MKRLLEKNQIFAGLARGHSTLYANLALILFLASPTYDKSFDASGKSVFRK